jgi:RNA recognition motif-containing protein
MIKLFVGGFPLDMDELGLAELFGPYGNISTVTIVRDKATKLCKGYGFIEMQKQEEANEAVAGLNGRQMGDRQLSVKPATEKLIGSGPISQLTAAYKKVELGTTVKKKRPRRAI